MSWLSILSACRTRTSTCNKSPDLSRGECAGFCLSEGWALWSYFSCRLRWLHRSFFWADFPWERWWWGRLDRRESSSSCWVSQWEWRYLAASHIFWAEWPLLYIFEPGDGLLVNHLALCLGLMPQVVDGYLFALFVGILQDLFNLVLHHNIIRVLASGSYDFCL